MSEFVEDSGFDSDQKNMNGIDQESPMKLDPSCTKKLDSNTYKALRKTSDLQKKIERQREVHRKAHTVVDQQPKKVLPSRSRLIVPSRKEPPKLPSDQQPLVMIDTDESEDEFAVGRLSRTAQREITQQLIKDGYNLDLEPDDEDLDLIPPKPLSARCSCCQLPSQNTCVVQ